MTDFHTTSGYRVIQVSALGRRAVSVFSGRASAEASSASLNDRSTGEYYEVEYYIGLPREVNLAA